jgi:hypothetical protein
MLSGFRESSGAVVVPSDDVVYCRPRKENEENEEEGCSQNHEGLYQLQKLNSSARSATSGERMLETRAAPKTDRRNVPIESAYPEKVSRHFPIWAGVPPCAQGAPSGTVWLPCTPLYPPVRQCAAV